MEDKYIKRFLLTDRQYKKLSSAPNLAKRLSLPVDPKTSDETFQEQIEILKLHGYKIQDLTPHVIDEMR